MKKKLVLYLHILDMTNDLRNAFAANIYRYCMSEALITVQHVICCNSAF